MDNKGKISSLEKQIGLHVVSAADQRVTVESVDPGSLAQSLGFTPGDVFIEVNGKEIRDFKHYCAVTRVCLLRGDGFDCKVSHEGKEKNISVDLSGKRSSLKDLPYYVSTGSSRRAMSRSKRKSSSDSLADVNTSNSKEKGKRSNKERSAKKKSDAAVIRMNRKSRAPPPPLVDDPTFNDVPPPPPPHKTEETEGAPQKDVEEKNPKNEPEEKSVKSHTHYVAEESNQMPIALADVQVKERRRLLKQKTYVTKPSGTFPDWFVHKMCTSKNCDSYLVRNNFCYRHQWKFDQPEEHLNKAERTQLQVAKEILSTEMTYFEELKIAYEWYMKPLETFNLRNESIIGDNIISGIFLNIADLEQLSAKMIADLRDLKDHNLLTKHIASILLHYAPQFRLYQQYLVDYDESRTILEDALKENVAFAAFVRWNERCLGTSLQAMLILPVQRLPRYLLLLKELQKQTKKVNNTDPSLLDMQAAEKKIQLITNNINASLHQRANQIKVMEIESNFERDSRFVEFALPTRYLAKEGRLRKSYSSGSRNLIGSKVYTFFLFNDMLLYATSSKTLTGRTQYNLKHIIPFSDVNGVVEKGGKKKDTEFILKTNKKSILLACTSPQEKTEWFEAFTKVLSEHKDFLNNMQVMRYDGTEGGCMSSKLKEMMLG